MVGRRLLLAAFFYTVPWCFAWLRTSSRVFSGKNDEKFALIKQIAVNNLQAWRLSGVVRTLKCYSAQDRDVCPQCADHLGAVVKIEDARIGINLPPFDTCTARRCRCYFRPCEISREL